jgi:hypothetical protein
MTEFQKKSHEWLTTPRPKLIVVAFNADDVDVTTQETGDEVESAREHAQADKSQ